MKKFLLGAALLILVLLAASLYLWGAKTSVVAHFLSRQLNVPVTIHQLDMSSRRASIDRLWLGNPPGSRTSTSFSSQTMTIDSTLDQILGNPLIIDEIDIADIFVGIEFYDASGTDNNWSRILDVEHIKKKKDSKDYLIRRLILTNLTVQVTKADGSVKRYPTIPRMEFHNISSETGFPISEIEKAIFDLVMKDLFRKLQLDELLRTIDPLKNLPGGSNLKNLPFFN